MASLLGADFGRKLANLVLPEHMARLMEMLLEMTSFSERGSEKGKLKTTFALPDTVKSIICKNKKPRDYETKNIQNVSRKNFSMIQCGLQATCTTHDNCFNSNFLGPRT